MKMFTGAQLLESFGGIAKGLDSLDHIAKGEVRCGRCGGTGWHLPSMRKRLVDWMRACPLIPRPRIISAVTPQRANADDHQTVTDPTLRSKEGND
jgi:hypothetical protein